MTSAKDRVRAACVATPGPISGLPNKRRSLGLSFEITIPENEIIIIKCPVGLINKMKLQISLLYGQCQRHGNACNKLKQTPVMQGYKRRTPYLRASRRDVLIGLAWLIYDTAFLLIAHFPTRYSAETIFIRRPRNLQRMQSTLNLRHALAAMACLSLIAAHTGDIAMPSLLFGPASERARLTGLALALDTEFAGLLSVTLWDELTRPAPAPRPVDTSGTTQFNAISNSRK